MLLSILKALVGAMNVLAEVFSGYVRSGNWLHAAHIMLYYMLVDRLILNPIYQAMERPSVVR